MSLHTNTILLNLCIIPPSNVGRQCENISQSLKSDGTLFVLGEDKFAHMTVYMARFPHEGLEKLVQVATDSLQAQKSFMCSHTGYFMTDGQYLEVSYRKSPEFLALHENLIKALSKYRANPGQPAQESYFGQYTTEQRQNAQETGYDLAYGLYRPHITLARYAPNKLPKAFPAMPTASLSFSCHKLALYEADENGAVFKKLHEFTI